MWFWCVNENDILSFAYAWWQMVFDVNLTSLFVCVIMIAVYRLSAACRWSRTRKMSGDWVGECSWR